MKALLQRVSQARVDAQGRAGASIGSGLLVFLGVEKGDTAQQVKALASKILAFRVFHDSQEKMNLSVQDVRGDLLVISQFTLCADTRKGTRPSFDPAETPQVAKSLYQDFVQDLRKSGLKVETGYFGESMKVSLVNEGPATFLLESS